jgi:hypothetical protein
MQRATRALALVGLGVLWLGAAASPATGVGHDIRRTAGPMLQDGAGGSGDVHAALRHLLDVARDLGREARLPASAQAKLDAASAEARRLSPLDGAVRAAAGEAYTALNQGSAFAFPREIGSIEQARAYGRGQVDRAVAATSAGRPQEAARELVGLVLLVITPMEARP